MRIYFDSSALTKLYLAEEGTQEAVKLCKQASELLLSCIVIPEFFSALNRRLREGLLNKNNYRFLKKEFSLDIEEATLLDLSPIVIQTTIDCLEQTPMRAFDAIHIASAKEAYCDLFVSADYRQYEAAKKLKLKAHYVGEKIS